MARVVIHNNVEASTSWAARPSRSVVVYSEDVLFDFFNEAGSLIECWKSIDAGETWAKVADVTTEGASRAFDIYYERWTDPTFEPIVHIANHVDFNPRGIMYSRINLETGIVSGEQTVQTWGATPSGRCSITVDSAGGIHMFGGGPTLSFTPYHLYSSDGGDAWTNTRSMAFTPSFNTNDLISAWPDFTGDAGDLLLVHGDNSAGGDLFLHRYDHSADTFSDVTIDATFDVGDGSAGGVGFAWRQSDGVLWVFGVTENDVSPATCKVWQIAGATVTARTDLVTETYLRAATGVLLADGRLAGVYAYDPEDEGTNSLGVFYKLSSADGVTWGSEVQYSEFTATDIRRVFSDPGPSFNVLPVVYKNLNTDFFEAPLTSLEADPDPTQFRLMLAEAADPDTPTLNITPHSANEGFGTLVKFERGYSSAVIGDPPAAALMTATLANVDLARYELDEPTPGLAMRLNKRIDSVWYHLCTANVDIPSHQMIGQRFRDEIEVSAYGFFAKLSGKTISTELFEDIPVGFAINELLDAANFPVDKRDIDAGDVRLPWWWINNADAMSELNKLRYSEGITSDLYEDGEGNIVFRSRSARFTEARSTAAQVSFTTEDDEPRLTGFQYFNGHREVINAATHTRKVRLAAGVPSVVWEDVPQPGGHYIVMPGLPITVEAVADEPFKDAITPVQGTDFQIASFGSTITVTLERTSGQRTQITFTATGDGGAIINELQLRATSVPTLHTVVETSTVDASASIAAYGHRPWTGEMSQELDWSDMRDNLDVIVNWRKAPRARVRFGLGAYRGEDANDQTAWREIGDRVRVVNQDLHFDGDLWVQRIEHEVLAPASSSDGSLPANEFTWYEGIVVSVAPGSSGSGVGGNDPYDEVDNGQGESPTTGLDDQGLLMRGIIGPLFGASDTPTITPPSGDPEAPPDPPIEGTTAGLVGFGRFNHDAYEGTFHMTSGTAGQRASMYAALADGARVIVDSGVLVDNLVADIMFGQNAQLLSPLDGAGAYFRARAPIRLMHIRERNVRLQNLTVHGYGDSSGDEGAKGIQVQGGNATDFWFDKLTIDHDQQSGGVSYNEGIDMWAYPTAAEAAGDGTISRTLFLGKTTGGVEQKAILIGSDINDTGSLRTRVTIVESVFEAYHRNALSGDGSKVHYINCVWPEKNRIYGIGVRRSGHVVAEGCSFEGSTQADRWDANANASGDTQDTSAKLYVPTSGGGAVRSGFASNGINRLINTAKVDDCNPNDAFNPTSFYGYTVQTISAGVAAAVVAAAGMG